MTLIGEGYGQENLSLEYVFLKREHREELPVKELLFGKEKLRIQCGTYIQRPGEQKSSGGFTRTEKLMQVVSGIWQTLIRERSKDCVKFKATVGGSLTVVKEKKILLKKKRL